MGVFDTMDAAFADVTTVASVAVSSAPSVDAFVDPANLHLFKRRAAPAWVGKDWEIGSEGLEREIVLDEKLVFNKGGCGAMREALVTGGVADDNPQWHLKLFAASFFKDPNMLAHKMSDKHHKYTIAEVEREMARIEADKTSRAGGMGWPGCDKFEQAGCKECALCPHRGKIRSPLNLALVKHEPKPGEQPAQTTGTVTFAGNEIYPGYARYLLPDGYVFNAKGHVCAVVEETQKTADGTETVTTLVPVLNNQYLLHPYVQQGPDALLFTIDGSKGELRPVMIERGILGSPQQTLQRAGEQGVAPHPQFMTKLGTFLMSLTRKIEELRQSARARPFGWVQDAINGGYNKFIYGKTFHRDGTVTEGGYLNEVMRQMYGPCGKIEPWLVAAQFVMDQQRMEFTLLLASTFAAPLMQFTAQPLVVLSVAGHSGIGKSTVLKIAAAAWGHPDDSRLTYDPTLNAAGHKMGMLANLPVYFDEVTDPKAQQNCLLVAMMDGQERDRLIAQKAGLQMRDKGHWSTIMSTTGNRSLLDYVANEQRDTPMGRYRIFEVMAYRREGEVKRERWEVDKILGELRFNYGPVGLVYAKFLAMKSATLGEMIVARGREFDKLVKATQEERFWSILCACVLLGAEFAVELGLVKFDLEKLRAFLVEAFLAQRNKLKADGQEDQGVAIELLTAFMKEHQPHMLVTDGLPERGGAKAKIPFNILREPGRQNNKGIHIQWVDRPISPILRISRDRLIDWLRDNKRQPSTVFDRIKHRIEKVVLGGKTIYAAGPERVMEIDILSDSWLRGVLCDIVGRNSDMLYEKTATGERAILDAAAVAKEKDQDHGQG